LVVRALEEVVTIDLYLYAMPGLLLDAWVVPEDEFFCFEIKQVGFFEDESYGLLLQLSIGLVEILDDFEVSLLVLEEEGFDL
jgi:hypothetical protein